MHPPISLIVKNDKLLDRDVNRKRLENRGFTLLYSTRTSNNTALSQCKRRVRSLFEIRSINLETILICCYDEVSGILTN